MKKSPAWKVEAFNFLHREGCDWFDVDDIAEATGRDRLMLGGFLRQMHNVGALERKRRSNLAPIFVYRLGAVAQTDSRVYEELCWASQNPGERTYEYKARKRIKEGVNIVHLSVGMWNRRLAMQLLP